MQIADLLFAVHKRFWSIFCCRKWSSSQNCSVPGRKNCSGIAFCLAKKQIWWQKANLLSGQKLLCKFGASKLTRNCYAVFCPGSSPSPRDFRRKLVGATRIAWMRYHWLMHLTMHCRVTLQYKAALQLHALIAQLSLTPFARCCRPEL